MKNEKIAFSFCLEDKKVRVMFHKDEKVFKNKKAYSRKEKYKNDWK